MALKGNLRDFTITQLLNLINLASKTGTLIIEGPNETAWISFQDGRLAYAQMRHEDNSLAAILHRSNRVSSSQYQVLKNRANGMGDKELGLLLINAGYVSKQDILTSVQAYFIDSVQRLFTWVEGMFRFENDVLPPDEKITVRVDLENLIIEGSRRMREWEQLQDEIPNLDMALKFTDRPGTPVEKLNLSVEEWKVISYINPKNSMRQIARATRMSDLEIRRIVYGLLQAGIVELLWPEGTPKPVAVRKLMTEEEKEEQVSLVNRLINRIRAL
jgi:hypothetical protein